MHRYRVSPAAAEDMNAIVDYLRERSPIAAVRFVEAAQATFEHLTHAASAYPRGKWADPRLAEVRSRPLTGAFHRYIVFYVERPRSVDIVRVLHSARDVERILGDDE